MIFKAIMKINTAGALYYLVGWNMDYFALLVAAFTALFLINSVVNRGMNLQFYG